MHDAKPTATPGRIARWLVELARTAAAGGATSGLGQRQRQRVIVAVAETNDSPAVAWISGAWRDFLGDAEPKRAEAEHLVLDYARACARAGHPLDPDEHLHAHLPPHAITAIRATVAQGELASLLANTAERFVHRATAAGRANGGPTNPITLAADAAVAATAAAIAVPVTAAAAAAKAITRAAPPLPTIETPPDDEANLLVHVLAATLPAALANAATRLIVLRLPVRISIALTSGQTSATVTLGRNTIVVANGADPDATIHVRGDVDALIRRAAGDGLERISDDDLRPTENT